MSKTVPVGFRNRQLWAFDVSLSILLAETVRLGQAVAASSPGSWLTPVLDTLRRHAILGANEYFDLDLTITDDQREQVLQIIADVARQLRHRGTITRGEAARWVVLDGHPVIWRNAEAVDTGPIADLGDALIDLVHGTLPDPPPGTWWYFGFPDGPHTIAMRSVT